MTSRTTRITKDRQLVFLITCLLLFTIFFCGQIALWYNGVDALPVVIKTTQTADYSPWEIQRFRQVDPRIGTQIVEESNETALPPQVAMLPTYTPSETPLSLDASVSTPTFTQEIASNTPISITTVPPETSTATILPDTVNPTVTITGTATPTTGFTPIASTTVAPITANFTANPISGTAPLTVAFTNLSTGPIISYSWNFGDGIGSSTAYQPSYIYNNPGSYVVTLTVSGSVNTASYRAVIVVSSSVVPTLIPPTPTFTVPAPSSTIALPTTVASTPMLVTPSATPTLFILPTSAPNSTSTINPSPTLNATLSSTSTIAPSPTWSNTATIPSPTATPTFTASITPTATPACSGTGTGLKGVYYDRDDYGNPRVSRIDPAIDFDWGTGSPDGSMGAETFSTRWTGFIEPCTTDTYQFILTGDEYARLWINGQSVVVLGSSGSATGSISLIGGQQYNLLMEYKEQNGSASISLLWQNTTSPSTVVPSANLYPPASNPTMICNGTGTGLQGDYYNTMDFTNFIGTRVDPNIDFDWGTNSPFPSVDPGTYSVRWTGKLQACTTDTYLFLTEVDDGIRVYLNGQLIIERWTLADYSTNAVPVNLTAGQQYDIVVEMYNDPVFGRIRLFWETSTQPLTIIPPSQFYLPAGYATPSPTAILLPSETPTSTPTATLPTDVISLTGICSTYWRIRNISNTAMTVNWQIYGTSETGTVIAEPNSDTFVITINVGTMTINSSNGETDSKGHNPTPCTDLTATPTHTATATETETPTPIPQADLRMIQMSVSNPFPNAGDTILYTIRILNGGTDNATDIQVVHDLIPSDFNFVTYSTSNNSSYDAATRVWSVGSLTTTSPGNEASIDIHVQLGAGTAGLSFTNNAWISASNPLDPDPSNDAMSTTITVNTPPTADLSLSLTSNNYTTYEGGNFTYILTLKNNSLIDASSIQVNASLPIELSRYYIEGSGDYDGTYWNIASLLAGEEKSLAIFVTGNPGTGGSTVTFSPSISVSNPTDSNSSNNAQTDTKYMELNPFYTDITVSNTIPNVGETITYTINAANFRGVPLSNVMIDAQLPSELTLVEAIPSIGIFDQDSGLWVIDSMDSSLTPYTMTVVATVNTGGRSIDYRTSIAAPGVDDNVVFWDNTDTVSITVP